MSDTPRTDAAKIPAHAIRLPRFPDGTYDGNVHFVPVAECECLERELNQCKKEIVAAKSELWLTADMDKMPLDGAIRTMSSQLYEAKKECDEAKNERDQWRECAEELAGSCKHIGWTSCEECKVIEAAEVAVEKFNALKSKDNNE